MSRDLRSFIRELEASSLEEIIRVKKEIDPLYESAAIITKLERQRKLPALIFERVKGSKYQLVSNINASRKRLAMAMGVPVEELTSRYLAAIEDPIEPKLMPTGPVHEVVSEGKDVDLRRFPQMVYHKTDGGPYITGGIVIVKDKDSGSYNASYHRLMMKEKDKISLYMAMAKHLNEMYCRAEDRGEPLQMAVSIGNHPLWSLGALYNGPFGRNELGIMGGLLGEGLEMVKCKTVDLMVPAHAEISLEIELLPRIRVEEGPFAEFSGYSVGKRMRAIGVVKAITERKDALFQDVCGGQHMEHLIMATVSMIASLYNAIKGYVPTLKAVHVPAPFTLFMSMKKREEGSPKNAILTAMAVDKYMELVVVVDEDIDVTNSREVLWAIATRARADRDVFIIPRTRGSELDPSSEDDGVVAKMGIDATVKPSMAEFPDRNVIPEEVMERIKLEDYLKI